jgi:hypothetical protein
MILVGAWVSSHTNGSTKLQKRPSKLDFGAPFVLWHTNSDTKLQKDPTSKEFGGPIQVPNTRMVHQRQAGGHTCAIVWRSERNKAEV